MAASARCVASAAPPPRRAHAAAGAAFDRRLRSLGRLIRGEAKLMIGGANATPKNCKKSDFFYIFIIYAPPIVKAYAPTRQI